MRHLYHHQILPTFTKIFQGLAGPSLGGEDVDPVEGVNKIALEIRFALGNSNFSPAELVGAADG